MAGMLLIGGGGHCKAAIDVIESEGVHVIVGILERANFGKESVLGYPVLGTDQDLPVLLGNHPTVLVTIGQVKSPAPRIRAFGAAEAAGAALPIVISPRAHVSRHATIGAGTLVMHGVLVNADAKVGRNVILNSQSLIEHDARIGDHCHISTGARVNGDVVIGDGCFVGSGAILKNGINIGAGSVIGAGCFIRHDLPRNSYVPETPPRPQP